jgi:uncharacterized membrane protein YcaP (DUF421 family)
MWNPGLPWWEFVLRGVIVYVFLMIALRVTGKRQTGQLAPFDLVLLLILSNAVQNAMNGGDNSVTGGIVSATTLIGLHYLFSWLTFKNRWLEALIDGKPRHLIQDGVVNQNVMRRELLTRQDLDAALRNAGVNNIAQVHRATLENNGQITVLISATAQR